MISNTKNVLSRIDYNRMNLSFTLSMFPTSNLLIFSISYLGNMVRPCTTSFVFPSVNNIHQKHKTHDTQNPQPIEEEQRPLVMGKGRLPEEAPADAGVQLKPVTLITPPEEVYSIPFSSINLMCISYLTGNFDQCDGM